MKTTWDELMRYAPEKEYPLPALERGEQERILNKTIKKRKLQVQVGQLHGRT